MTQTEAEAMTAVTRAQNGSGQDASPLQRPGVPQEQDPAQPLASAHWITPDQQQSSRAPLVGHGMKLTPVFSTAVPVRGLSGLMRRAAYRIADHKARRWLLLMAADRVDVLEHRPPLWLRLGAGLGLITLGAYAARRAWRTS